MRILTVRQPWAAAIVHLGKTVENRSRNIAGDYRGPVAIHAAAPKPDDARYAVDALTSPHFDRTPLGGQAPALTTEPWMLQPAGLRLHQGVVLGVVDLVDVHRWSGSWGCQNGKEAYGVCRPVLCSTWAMREGVHLVLANPRPLTHPIAAKGRLGMWRPTEALVSEISVQLLGGA